MRIIRLLVAMLMVTTAVAQGPEGVYLPPSVGLYHGYRASSSSVVTNISVSPLGDLNLAITRALPGAVITVDASLLPKRSVMVNKPVRIIFQQTVDFSMATDRGHGIVVTSPGVELIGLSGVVSIQNTYLSAVLVASGADDCLIDGVSVQNYNTSNTNGNAGLFALGVPSQVNRLRAYRFKSLGGNGNGIRLGNVMDCVIRDSFIALTRGQSAEGVTVNGSNVDLVRVVVYKAMTTGILVFLDRDQSNIRVTDCTISDSSQAVLKPPAGTNQPGSNFALEVQANQYHLSGLVIDNLCAYDDQTVATQNGPLKIGNNNQHGTVSLRPPTFTSWGNKTEIPELIFDNPSQQYKVLA